MHKERILALADLIEKQPHTTREAESGFTMDNWTHDCGTPACIAGWTIFAENNSQRFEPGSWVSSRAMSYLDLDRGQADDLFYPELRTPEEIEDDAEGGMTWQDITPGQAAATLRHLAATGVVDWSVTLSNDSQSAGGEADV